MKRYCAWSTTQGNNAFYQTNTLHVVEPVILNTWIGNGSVIYVYRKTIRVAPTWILNWMAAVDSDEYDMDADPSGRVSGV